MSNLNDLRDRYAKFIRTRDWERYHTPQNVAAAISVEADELHECFLWHDNVAAERIKNDSELVDSIRDELADIVIYCLSMCIQLDVDLLEAVEEKLEENEGRFDDEETATIVDELDRWQRSSDSPD
jgi:NTP pyrophosphatase (non-canonical NTP hydrolase)